MLGIVVSLRWELRTLTRESISLGACKPIRDDTLLALAGIGAPRAHGAAELLLARGATALLSWGFAAALDPSLKPGCVILPERVISATGESYPVSADWHRRLYRILSVKLPVATAALLESEMIVSLPESKHRLAQQTQAVAVDMESCAQARLAQARGIPFVVVRAVSDTASTQIPQSVMKTLGPSGEVKIGSCLARALRQPRDGIAMIRLGMQFNAARKSLTKASALVLDASRVYLDSLSTTGTPAARW